MEAAQINNWVAMYRTTEKLQALGDKEKDIRLSPGRPKRMEHNTKTSKQISRPAEPQKAAQSGIEACRQVSRPAEPQKAAQSGIEACR